MADALAVPLTRNAPSANSRSSAVASSMCAAIGLALSITFSRRLDHRDAADDQRARAVGVHALRRGPGVAVQHLDVLERHAELVGDDLAPRRLVPLAVRRAPVTTSTLPVGSIRIDAASQPPAP